MVANTKGLGPEKDCAGEGQQHVQKGDPSSRQRGRLTNQERNCQTNKYLRDIGFSDFVHRPDFS
jgi:hypothetical protein